MDRDRTYGSAVALRDFFVLHHLPVTRINIVTENTHARRTRLVFQKALGPGIKVGILAAQNPDYDPAKWWRYSEGTKDVATEALSYVYARLFFHPSLLRNDEHREVVSQS